MDATTTFYTGILLGRSPSMPILDVLDQMSYRSQACTTDTLRDSAITHKTEGAAVLSAKVYKNDLDGNSELVETIDLPELFWPAGTAV